MRYDNPKQGEWIRPVRKGYRTKCCDCGLVHVIDYRIVRYGSGRKVEFRVRRDQRATVAIRRRTHGKIG